MCKFKPKYRCEILIVIFCRYYLTYNYLLKKRKLFTYKKIKRVLLQFSFNYAIKKVILFILKLV